MTNFGLIIDYKTTRNTFNNGIDDVATIVGEGYTFLSTDPIVEDGIVQRDNRGRVKREMVFRLTSPNVQLTGEQKSAILDLKDIIVKGFDATYQIPSRNGEQKIK